MSTWHHLRETFDQTLAEPRAIALRGGPSDLRLATLASNHRHGFGFNFGQLVAAEHSPDVVLRWSSWIHGQPRFCNDGPVLPAWHEPVFSHGRLGPDVIERGLRYVAAGLELTEELLRTPAGHYLWSSTLQRQAYRPFNPRWRPEEVALPWRLHLLIEARRPLHITTVGGCLVLSVVGGSESLVLACAAEQATWGTPVALAEHDLEATAIDLWHDTECPPPAGPGRRFALPLTCRLLPAGQATLALAIGIGADPASIAALLQPGAVQRERAAVAQDWSAWIDAWQPPRLAQLPTLDEQLAGRASRNPPPTYRDRHGRDQAQLPAVVRPLPELGSDDLARAYRKCLALTRLCERHDPAWGRSLTETFTCYYSGSFGWSLPVIGWYARRQPDPAWRTMMQDILNSYLAVQASDGAFPCYIGFNQPRPATPPASHSHTQQPQYAWAIWQEFQHSGNQSWLAAYPEPLLRYSAWMDSRDVLGLGLWCQHHYYDGIDMFPTVDGLVLRGDRVLYSAAYAAEQVQFKRATARILRALGDPRADAVAAEAEATWAVMIERLWDRERQWFGDILADGRRETVVGIQGLFALAYGLAPADADPVRLRGNLEALIAPFGVCTVAPEDARYCERFFWRGPVWPASCLYGSAAARRYAPDLLPRMAAATVRCALAQPNIWECLEPHSGQVARYDEGHGAMPGTSSVVGSFAICAALDLACGGADPFAL